MDDAYDERPYTEHAYAETHPSRLAAVARMAGWEPPAIGRARVLELGCGRGGNLLPMAAGLPDGRFVGVDRSGRQIDDARRVAGGTGLGNVAFVRASFEDRPAAGALDGGPFDYVVCHGVLSWIPASARPVLLDRIARSLAPGGVAHVSFNVLPGWYERLAARDWLRFAASSLGLEAEGAANSVMWLRDQVSPEHADARRRLEAVGLRLAETDPAYARHEYLAGEHHPLRVRAFLDEATTAGLAYLGDAVPATTAFEMLPDDARARTDSLDDADAQQLIDFVRLTAFRRAVLVRGADATARSWRPPRALDRGALRSLQVASRLRAKEAAAPGRSLETFEDGHESVQVSGAALGQALRVLAVAAPAPVPFIEVLRRLGDGRPLTVSEGLAQEIASELFDLGLATGAVDWLVDAPSFARAAGERPLACPVARWHAAHGGVVTNRLHQEVLLPDAIVRWVLARLDGTRTREALAHEARSIDGAERATGAQLRTLMDASIERLAACAVLLA